MLTSIFLKVLSDLFRRENFKVGNETNVDVSSGARVKGLSDSRSERAGMFTPVGLDPTVVDRNANVDDMVSELYSMVWVDERDKLQSATTRLYTYGNILLLDVSDLRQRSTSDVIAELFGGGLGMNVAKIDVAIVGRVDVDGELRGTKAIAKHGRAKARLRGTKRSEGGSHWRKRNKW